MYGVACGVVGAARPCTERIHLFRTIVSPRFSLFLPLLRSSSQCLPLPLSFRPPIHLKVALVVALLTITSSLLLAGFCSLFSHSCRESLAKLQPTVTAAPEDILLELRVQQFSSHNYTSTVHADKQLSPPPRTRLSLLMRSFLPSFNLVFVIFFFFFSVFAVQFFAVCSRISVALSLALTFWGNGRMRREGFPNSSPLHGCAFILTVL